MMLSDEAQSVLARLEAEAHEPKKPRVSTKTARFKVAWNFDRTTSATVKINRRAGTFEVRPYRKRAAYVLPLSDVAEMVASRISKANAEKRRSKKRRARR